MYIVNDMEQIIETQNISYTPEKTTKKKTTLHKKWSFPLRISSVNGGFGHLYWRNP